MRQFSFHGNSTTKRAAPSVRPFERPHPPLWMMSRDPQILEFWARNAINPGGYFLIYSHPRSPNAERSTPGGAYHPAEP